MLQPKKHFRIFPSS